MKPGMSLLNPYAAPFIPSSSLRAGNENVASITSESSNIDNATVQYKQAKEHGTKATKRTCGDSNPNCYIEGPSGSGDLLGKDCNIHSFEDPVRHKRKDGTGRHGSFEAHELDLAYLIAEFPGISEQSLVDVYCANAGDLEASIDMLIQLEDDDILRLPDTLDVLDISDSGTADESLRTQKKTAHGEASGSSSHPFTSIPALASASASAPLLQ